MKTLAKILYGSQNYGIDNEDSDKDYKMIVIPTGVEWLMSTFLSGGPEHEKLLDFRAFINGLMEGNLGTLELMVSREVTFYDTDFQKLYYLLQGDVTDCLAGWNASRLSRALKGISFSFLGSWKEVEVVSPKNAARGYFFALLYKYFDAEKVHFNEAWDMAYKVSKEVRVRERTEEDGYLKFVDEAKAIVATSIHVVSFNYGKEVFLNTVLLPMIKEILKKGMKKE